MEGGKIASDRVWDVHHVITHDGQYILMAEPYLISLNSIDTRYVDPNIAACPMGCNPSSFAWDMHTPGLPAKICMSHEVLSLQRSPGTCTEAGVSHPSHQEAAKDVNTGFSLGLVPASNLAVVKLNFCTQNVPHNIQIFIPVISVQKTSRRAQKWTFPVAFLIHASRGRDQ